jgi:hypothetical protein
MRPTIATCVLLLFFSASLAWAQSATAPATQQAVLLQPAPTPGEAVERSMQAMVDSDEAKYRQSVDVKSPSGYSEACTRWTFASARLHKAVRDHNVTGQRLREAGFDRNQTLSPGIPPPPSAKEWEAMRKAIRAIEWEVDGSVARPKGNPSMFSGGTQGKTSIERSGDGWVVVIADPVESAPAEHLQQLAKGWSAKTTAIDAATEQVRAGKLKTILEVNDFVDAEMKKVDRGGR